MICYLKRAIFKFLINGFNAKEKRKHWILKLYIFKSRIKSFAVHNQYMAVFLINEILTIINIL